jgi:predicted dehydrogenase
MKKYAIVGAGNRGQHMYATPLYEKFGDVAKIVGVYDTNYKRSEILKGKAGGNFPVYYSFDEMLNSSKPDVVIVTTVDQYHDEYIIKSLEAGCDAITEKPMTTDVDKCNAILEAEKRTGKRVIVTFNARCGPFSTKIKQLIKGGAVGDVLSVHFEWLLDTVHGASYFRRWHRQLKNSGGLLVHKSTHHFDMVNWFIEEDPVSINAYGTRRFYGPTRKERGERCLTCNYKNTCEYYFDITEPYFKTMYLDCEDVDGYFRDGCIFSDEIDICDSMSLNVNYSKGTVMSYSLTAHSPYEGYKLAINGTNGRLEAETFTSNTYDTFAGPSESNLRLYNRKGEMTIIKVPRLKGSHGGSDYILQNLLFRGGNDPMNYVAGSRAGAMSLIIGAAANKSIQENTVMYVKDLLKDNIEW